MTAAQVSAPVQAIDSPNQLGGGWYDCKQFESEEAARAAGFPGLLYKSKILPAWYLFVKVEEQAQGY